VKFLFAGVLIAAPVVVAAETQSDPKPIEEVMVFGTQDVRTIELVETLDITPDTGALLKKTVGANLVSNGPLSGIAQYRGMSRMRISTHIDGAVISPGGPNWMDPPLSYAPSATVETLQVIRGIAPVSAGQETIGGVVNARNWRGEFSESGLLVSGRARSGVQSVNEGTQISAGLALANENHLLSLSGFREQANDADFADGRVEPTEYERDRFDLGYGYRNGTHSFGVTFGRNNTGDAGTPALAMDIEYIDGDLYGFSHRFDGEMLQLENRVYYNDIDHGMTNYHLRNAPMDPGMFRRNITDAKNLGFTSVLSVTDWKVGIDAHTTEHNSNIDNPNKPMFFVENFNNAQRDSYGVFAEYNKSFNESWSTEFGLRYNRIESNADEVNATSAMMGMPPAVALRDNFNDADRKDSDDNVDWVAKVYYQGRSDLTYYAGVARKSRAPSYQERYLWLPLQATAGLADGLTYTGNLDLDSEIAHEAELGVDWALGALSIRPRVFYRYVDDYIQGTPSTNAAAVMFVRMMNANNGTSNPDPLEFNNVDARFYGFDVDWSYQFNERWAASGVVNYVRGERDDSNDDLYRVPPLNAFIALNYSRARWGLTAESFLYDDQDDVSETNQERTSDGYAVFNLKGYWNLNTSVRIALGVDNLADENYEDHLAGVNRVRGNPDLAVGDRLPGYGRNFFGRVDVQF
jgi:iron complex outermembrane receptor protein